MIIICCIVLGIVIASIVGGTLAWTSARSRTERHTNTEPHAHSRDKSRSRHTCSQFSRFHECNRLHVWHQMRCVVYDAFYTHCTGPEVFSHELLFCKCVVLQNRLSKCWVSSKIWCFLNEKVTKTMCNAILIHSDFQMWHWFSCNVHFVLYRQSDKSLICSVFKAMLLIDPWLFVIYLTFF